MKKMLLGIILASTVYNTGWTEYAGNPDRFPSIGLNYTGAFTSGDATVTDLGLSTTQSIENTTSTFAADLRFPISDSVTLVGALGFSGDAIEATETKLLAGQKIDTGGLFLNIGIRFYIR